MNFKKTTFLIVTLFIGYFSPLIAAEENINAITNHYNGYGKSFTFVEGGITFSIFQNGEFDFYLNSRFNNVQAGINFGNVSITYNSGYNYDAYIQYDDYGAIIQIESIPIYYDYYGRISQAGSVSIEYHDRRLVRVGGLHIHYNNYGSFSHCSGYINSFNRVYVSHPFHDFFVRPLYTHSIVSYMPYRRYYKPIRRHYRPHRHDYYKRFHKNAYSYNGKYRNKRNFRSIDSKVRTKDNNRRAYNRRSNEHQSGRVVRNDNNRRWSAQNKVRSDRQIVRNKKRGNLTGRNVRSTIRPRNSVASRNSKIQKRSSDVQ